MRRAYLKTSRGLRAGLGAADARGASSAAEAERPGAEGQAAGGQELPAGAEFVRMRLGGSAELVDSFRAKLKLKKWNPQNGTYGKNGAAV